jgi:hypothetical protein
MWIDVKILEAEIAKFTPLVTVVTGMIPGTAGTTILSFLRAITAPNVLEPVVNLVNSLTGATPPAA